MWVHLTGRRTSGQDPGLGTVWIIDDIAERKEAERKLLEGHRLQRALIDAIPVPIFVKDSARRFIDCNESFSRWVGFDRAALLGRTVHCIAAPSMAELADDVDQRLLSARRSQTYDTRLIGADGVERDVEVSKTAFFSDDGRIIGIVGAMIDITERKSAEQALLQRKAFFEQMFTASLAVMLLIDPADGRIVDANPAAAEFYRHALDRLRTLRVSDIESEAEGASEAEGRARGRIEFRHRRSDGEVRDVEVFSSPVTVDGRALRLSLVHDITERHRAEETLRILATTDSLTGLCNRRFFLECAIEELRRLRANGQAASVLMIDIDHFKLINDTYGHAGGDEALRRVALACSTTLRDGDVIGRMGGEEFCALLVGSSVTAAGVTAERVRAVLAGLRVTAADGRAFSLTASIGVAECRAEDSTVEQSIGRADHALYRAKAEGRNRVVADDA